MHPAPSPPDATSELDSLPPLDGDAADDEQLEELGIDALGSVDDPFDDEEASELDGGQQDFGGEEASAVGDDREGLRIEDAGEVAIFTGSEASYVGRDEDPDADDEDYGFTIDPKVSLADGGEEGLDESVQELRAEDLPPLDADDDETEGEPVILEDGLGGTVVPADAWHDRPFEHVATYPTEARLTAFAVTDEGAYFFAGRLWFVRERGQAREIDGQGIFGLVVSLSAKGRWLDAQLEDGSVLRSSDAGRTFAALDTEHDAFQRPPSCELLDGRKVVALERYGRTVLVSADTVVADLSSDIDAEGEESQVVALDQGAGVLWVATPFAVACYRVS